MLTAAGFTKNFGGFLAKEMWDKIFNCPEVQDRPNLKNLLWNNFDYESIYHNVLDGDYSNEEKVAINTAIFEAYKKLDHIACEYIPAIEASRASILSGAKNLIKHFTRNFNQINYFFTLNQDLFVERLFSDINKPIASPGIKRIVNPGMHSRLPLNDADFITTPNQKEINTKSANNLSKNEFHYVKLHGSFGWKSSDGSNKMVIGKNKYNQIIKEPLLSWYFELFEQVLFQEEIKLMIIGYGFHDDHINIVIEKSIEKYGAKLFIISPSSSNEFKNELSKIDHGEKILSGISRYFTCNFTKLFPPNQPDTYEWNEIKNLFS